MLWLCRAVRRAGCLTSFTVFTKDGKILTYGIRRMGRLKESAEPLAPRIRIPVDHRVRLGKVGMKTTRKSSPFLDAHSSC